MAEIINPHDKFFKEMLTQPEAARIFLRDFLPPTVAEQLDLSRLQLVKDSFIDETLQAHFSDLVYHGAAPWIVATNFQGLFELPEALSVYVPEFHYAPTGTCAPLSGSGDSLRGGGWSGCHCGECAGGNRGRCAGRRCHDRYNCTGMVAAGIAAGIAAGVAAGVA
ncbi:MAG: Rpn family recombination-promoting nuclease/putative transposase, partial [Caldilinea sp.]